MSESIERGRRRFLQTIGLSFGGAWLTLNSAPVLAAAEEARALLAGNKPFVSFNTMQAGVLGAVADQIYPEDDTAGAKALGAVHFMDTAFQGFMAGALPGVLASVGALNEAAIQAHGKGYAQIPFDEQTQLLRAQENTPFFFQIHFLTLAGCFSLPSYGGNVNGEGWAQIGFERRHVWQPPFGHYDAQVMKEKSNGST